MYHNRLKFSPLPLEGLFSCGQKHVICKYISEFLIFVPNWSLLSTNSYKCWQNDLKFPENHNHEKNIALAALLQGDIFQELFKKHVFRHFLHTQASANVQSTWNIHRTWSLLQWYATMIVSIKRVLKSKKGKLLNS